MIIRTNSYKDKGLKFLENGVIINDHLAFDWIMPCFTLLISKINSGNQVIINDHPIFDWITAFYGVHNGW